MTEALQFTHGRHELLRDERRTEPRQFERPPLQHAFVIVASLLEMILESAADALQDFLKYIVKPRQFESAGFEPSVRRFSQPQCGFARGVLDHGAVRFDFLEQHGQTYGVHVSPSSNILSRKRHSDSSSTSTRRPSRSDSRAVS